ncbi:hypothetical protein [Mesoflavibacter sp. SCSIO 43206]|uniref:hypothetical protein n=1 Tax=Mesoflavibacter sp. SCSIO 43206 TaxID=2779362 RepID=UPI001CA8D861|nr:hypothetical protein [Mesoflavibacter sp. SCSIO 43206]UAB74329.1 hypothetical protein INR78_07945 [Mesoflavibacter sp. SCSIO 43206]
MPKRNNVKWTELLVAITPKGHRWKNVWHLLNVVFSYLFSDGFKSSRRWLVYIMYLSNWVDLKKRPYFTLSNQDLADIVDDHLKLTLSQEEVYRLFNTTRHTYKKNFSNYLDLSIKPKIGEIILVYITKWQDSNQNLSKPITKKQLAQMSGLYHKKLAYMFIEVPQAKDYFYSTKLSYENIKQFPPRLVECFFEEIGEPERFEELILLLKKEELY